MRNTISALAQKASQRASHTQRHADVFEGVGVEHSFPLQMLQGRFDFADAVERKRFVSDEQRPCLFGFGDRPFGVVEGLGELQGQPFAERTPASLRDRSLYLVPLEIG